MPDTKYPISGSIRVWWLASNGLANPQAPTVAEINAGIDVSDAVSWNDMDFGVSASNQTSDPAITARGNVQDRGAAQYGGSFSFYYPQVKGDTSNKYSIVYEALRRPTTRGFIIVRTDGLELQQTAGTTANPGTLAAAGDFVDVYDVETAGYAESITGEEAFRYTVSLLPKGRIKTYAIVRATAAAVVPVVAGAATGAVGAKIPLTASIVSRPYTRGVVWTTTTPNFVSVSRNGVVTGIAAGAASVVATDPATNTPSTPKVVTIS